MAGDPTEFKRAFSGATLNDGFNLLTTIVLLPIEIIFGFLDLISFKLANVMIPNENVNIAGINFVGAIVNPVTDIFIQLDTDAVNKLAAGDKTIQKTALRCCSTTYKLVQSTNQTLIQAIMQSPNYTTVGLVNLNNVTANNISFDQYVLIHGIFTIQNIYT